MKEIHATEIKYTICTISKSLKCRTSSSSALRISIKAK